MGGLLYVTLAQRQGGETPLGHTQSHAVTSAHRSLKVHPRVAQHSAGAVAALEAGSVRKLALFVLVRRRCGSGQHASCMGARDAGTPVLQRNCPLS